MQKMPFRVGSANLIAAPAISSSALAVAALATLATGLLALAEPALAQQGFGNFYTYQPRHKRYAVKRRHAPSAA